MNWPEIVSRIIKTIESYQSIEGAFLAGSLVTENEDQFSDIDMGIVAKNHVEDFQKVYALKTQLMTTIGHPIHFLERGWGHCKMIAILYGTSEFPPIGLEVDLIFSELRHISEQMPYATYKVVFDRTGRVQQELDRLAPKKPKNEIRQELKRCLDSYPFYVHDAVKAYRRGDKFHFQSLLDEIRNCIFFVAAIEKGSYVYGSKRGFKYLSSAETQLINASYQQFTPTIVSELTRLYTHYLTQIQTFYHVEPDIELLGKVVAELL